MLLIRKLIPSSYLVSRFAQTATTDFYGFKNLSVLYNNFRPEYPDRLLDYIIDDVKSRQKAPPSLGIDPTPVISCALDIACGTGLFTRKLAPFFKRTVGTDLSEKQLKVAAEQNEGDTEYAKFDAYDVEGMLRHFSLQPSEVSLISVATAMHWLDFDRLAEKIVEVFPAGATSLAVTGYLPAQIMNQNILNNDIFGGSSLNVHGELRDARSI
ncbi:uncharacterized protein LOC142342443 isoform X3 [Convolutriloba macropyga]|uniref:uncharacterized protein LOC142342443 isoform X3 n=1 Tax=Convolutriloba macropyga TaxID=536237 RepID=UPI003F520F07